MKRARKKGATGTCSAEQLAARFALFGNCCAYCGAEGELHAEHVIPLAEGGTNWPANYVPACPDCNLSKHTKRPSDWFLDKLVSDFLKCRYPVYV